MTCPEANIRKKLTEFSKCLPSKVYAQLKPNAQVSLVATVVKNPPANVGDTGLNPGPGRSHMPGSN